MASRIIRTLGGRIIELGSFAHADTFVLRRVSEAAQEPEDARFSAAEGSLEGMSPRLIRALGDQWQIAGLGSLAHVDSPVPGKAFEAKPEGDRPEPL
jgi:hypothetical protein